MKWTQILGSAAALVAACAIVSPATARADEPTAGTDCNSSELNLTTTSTAGEGLRCLADNLRGYTWQKDDGTTQSPDDAERVARDACAKLPHHSNRSSCRSLLDSLPQR
ncbi:hypothetical protein KIH27_01145 [Mycobacterium sp. M1]|uniref:Uncharacterized protein n=1 Tax=Mycolicibacter acidiphilus TaxID=2835306 RepID=A0ABS5RGU9_9MYCO|nr:hypothetical protein [Mycolicibacter acidiphilus]MBS9532189.1 hypothetical protein [Mycolicibacter acidiphilus]